MGPQGWTGSRGTDGFVGSQGAGYSADQALATTSSVRHRDLYLTGGFGPLAGGTYTNTASLFIQGAGGASIGGNVFVGGSIRLWGTLTFATATEFAWGVSAAATTGTVTIGANAGTSPRGSGSVAIGSQAGQARQGGQAIAIGQSAGISTQSVSAVAIGYLAGAYGQGINAIAIGNNAGLNFQSSYSIALNATGFPLSPAKPGLFITPIDQDTTAPLMMYYNSSTSEVTWGELTRITQPVKILNTTVATSTTTGALSVAGGLGVGGFIVESVSPSVAANGTTYANATALTSSINIIGNNAANQGVALPTAYPGMVVTLYNVSTTTATNVYAPLNSGARIDVLSTTNAYSLPATAGVRLIAATSAQLYTI
jgi:hypothetical protein